MLFSKSDGILLYFSELENMVEPWVDLVKLVFDTFDYLAMFIYVMEIILKWMDSFTDFWKSSWNVFDCVVTFMVFITHFAALLI